MSAEQAARRVSARLDEDGIKVKPSMLADIVRIVEETSAQETIRVLSDILGAMRELNASMITLQGKVALEEQAASGRREERRTLLEKVVVPAMSAVISAFITGMTVWSMSHGVVPTSPTYPVPTSVPATMGPTMLAPAPEPMDPLLE